MTHKLRKCDMFLRTFFQKIRKKSDEERWQRAFLRFLRPDERLAEQVFVAEARTDFVVLPLEAVAVTVVGTTAVAYGEYAARAASGVGEVSEDDLIRPLSRGFQKVNAVVVFMSPTLPPKPPFSSFIERSFTFSSFLRTMNSLFFIL